MNATLVKTIVKATIDPAYTREIAFCKWGMEKQLLMAPKDKENEKMEAIEQAA
jgi:hypothetical protein